MSIDQIEPAKFHYVSTKLREFFAKKGLIEVPTQHRLSILAACEQPDTIATFEYEYDPTGKQEKLLYPLPQTGQMWLEKELLTNPKVPGYFCYTTSYRQEKKSSFVKGRHQLIFPMFEFEIHGDMLDLFKFEEELLEFLGYDKSKFLHGNYSDFAKFFGVEELEHSHEAKLGQAYPVVFIKNFPHYTSPFWNMKADMETKTSKKIDVILHGQETIGSAERSCNVEEMRKMFYEISDGIYAKTLFEKFGRERVERELDEFLALPMIPRCGAGIGITRLIRSLERLGVKVV